MNSFKKVTDWIISFWSTELFELGQSEYTVKTLFYLLISLFLLFYLTGKLKKLMLNKIFPRYNMDIGVSQSIATILRYFLVVVGLVIIFQTTGIDLSAIGLLLGALGIGIGFGLQNITNNF